MKSFIQQSLFCLCLLACMAAARPSAAQLPAFKDRSTNMCLTRYHFTEQELLGLTKETYPNLKSHLTSDGNGLGYFAWKTISHPNVGQGINLGFSFPSELGMSWKPKEMLGSTFPGSERIGNFLNGFGAVLIMGQLVEDISTDNPQLQINLGKNTAYWIIGASKLFSTTMKISSIGIQIFDYTLNQLGTTAVSGNKQLWYTAYKNYFDTEYGHKAGNMDKWNQLLAENGGNLNQALKNMHQKFWNDDFRESFKKQQYIWSNAEPSDAVKEEVRVAYLQETLPFLTNYYRVQRQNARNAAVRKANSIYNDMVDFMNRDIVFSGTVRSSSGRPLAGVKVSLFGTHPVISNAQGEYRDVFRMCELIPELGKSNNKILATAYYTPDTNKPPRIQKLSRPIGTGFMRSKDEINDVQDRLDFVFKTDDWIELTVRPQNAELEGGATTNLTAICLRDDGSSLNVTDQVEWQTDQPAIATVSHGQLTAMNSKGIANITAIRTKGGVTLTSNPCKVFVKYRREVDQLTIQPAKVELQSNQQVPIKSVALFNDGTVKNVTIDPECKWRSQPPALQVTPQGRLQAGVAVWGQPDHTLTATYTFRGKAVSASIPVRLLSTEKATDLKLNKTEVVMGTNENVGLRATVLIGKGTATYPADVTTQVVWTVSDKSIITQTAGGVIVSGGKEGYCGVKAEYRQPNGPALQAICTVTVVDKNRPLPTPDFSIDPKEDPHPVGESITFRSILPASSTSLELTWHLDGKEIPDQSEVTHRFDSPGTYTIRFFVRDPATDKSDAAVKTIHVEARPEEAVTIGFKPETNVYTIGTTVEFIAKAKKLNPQTGYRWYVAGEFIGEGAKGVTHKFTEDGEYEIKLGLRRDSNFDEEKIIRTLTVGEAGIGTLGRLRNRFNAIGAPGNLEIQSQYFRGGSGDWSKLIRFNGGRIGPVDHFIHYDGDQADGYNTGFLVYVPEGKNELRFKVFHFRWPSNPKIGPLPQGFVHYEGRLDLHNKVLVPDSVNFTRKASRLCEVEWRTEDGSSCRARINKFKKSPTIRYSGVEDLRCEEGVYEPVVAPDDTDAEPDTVVDTIPEENNLSGEMTLPFSDDFSSGLGNWDTQFIQPDLSGGKLYWNDPTHKALSTRQSFPFENVVIEFDAWCDKDGLPVRWENEQGQGYLVVMGSWLNTRSLSAINQRDIETLYGSHITFKKWQHYRILRQGDLLQVSVDGTPVISRQISDRVDGTGTLRFHSYSRVGIDNVRISHSGSEPANTESSATLSERLVSGAYRVEVWCPTAYSSIWQLQVINDRITGMSKWTCCPAPRNDPLSGRIDGDTVVINRDCTGQGYSGACSQDYTGKFNGNTIEGSFTMNGRHMGTWKLYLDGQDDPSLTDSSQTSTGTQGNDSDSDTADNDNGETDASEDNTLGGGGPGSGMTDLEGTPDGASGGSGGQPDSTENGSGIDDIGGAAGNTPSSGTPADPGIAPDISGTWKWFNGVTTQINKDGTCHASNGNNGTWKSQWNGSGFTYTISWENGKWIDTFVLHENTLDGHNQNGTHVWGKRINASPATTPPNPAGNTGSSPSASVSGNWTIHQDNGFSGKLTFFQDPAGGLTGEANFGSLHGRLTGRLSGPSVEFTIQYPDGLKGHYAGTLSPDGTRLENGTSTASNGGTASWNASRALPANSSSSAAPKDMSEFRLSTKKRQP